MVGTSSETAVASLETLGLVVVVAEVESYDGAPGTVLAAEPTDGTALVAGDTVTLSVAVRPSECNDTPADVPSPSFTDTADLSGEASGAVAWAAAVGLISDGSTFRPSDPMTRSSAVTVLHRYMCEPTGEEGETFSDVPADSFFAPAVDWASGAAIIGGVGDGRFGADEAISRGAFITIVWRALGEPEGDADNPFADVLPGDFHHDAVVWAFSAGLVGGTSPTTFSPDDALDRITTIVVFHRLEQALDPLVGG